jgi:hypothetical protein
MIKKVLLILTLTAVPAAAFDGGANPVCPDSPGMIIGTTFYDAQTTGTTGIRIAYHECGTHFAWMNGIDQWTGNRWVYYNFLDAQGNLGWPGGTPVGGAGGVYPQLATDDQERALIAYHNTDSLMFARDIACGYGLFSIRRLAGDFYWPYINYDYSGNIHILMYYPVPGAGEPTWFCHIYSTDGGSNWSELGLVDSVMCISGIPVSSPVDNKVAIVYTRPIVVEGQLSQIVNDVAYIESEDGITWNYAEIVNVTNYDTLTDSVFAYTDLAACYDYNGDLHILWNAPAYWVPQGIYALDSCLLFHWSENTGINLVFSAWHNSYPGAWNRSASKMSLACDSSNNLYALWTHFDDSDVSQGGYSNGELYLAWSGDGGQTWSPDTNLTNSPTPGCAPGDCQSDHWSSMARVIDDSLRILYIEDKDAGGIPQGEGAETENPIRYLVLEKPALTRVDDNDEIPSSFSLGQNYPNPFNASTNIGFTLDRDSDIALEVFNILGEKVATLADGRFSKGDHTVSWDGSAFSSGIYFYRMNVNAGTQTRRMVMFK